MQLQDARSPRGLRAVPLSQVRCSIDAYAVYVYDKQTKKGLHILPPSFGISAADTLAASGSSHVYVIDSSTEGQSLADPLENDIVVRG